MYYYLYDSFLSQKKYYQILAKIETRLTDLGINGKINHLSFLKNIQQVLSEEVKRGIKNIIAVGNDKTFSQVINLAADLNVTIGFIPIGENNTIAKLLGIPEGEKACDVLSSRIVEKIDLGKINNYYFLTSVEMIGQNISLELDDSCLINLEGQNSVVNISNLNHVYQTDCRPNDDYLNVFIETREKKLFKSDKKTLSQLAGKKIKITSKKTLPILLSDEKRIIKTPALAIILPKKIKVIMGKNRIFE